MKSVCFLGCGNLVNSLVEGYLNNCNKVSFKFSFYSPSKVKAKKMSEVYSGQFIEDLSKLQDHDIYIFGFKPQSYKLAKSIYQKILKENSEIWSLLAGKSSIDISEDFTQSKVLRIMPNVCSAVGEGITLYTCAHDFDEKAFSEFFGGSSKLHRMKNDNLLDKVTGVSGSGPALIYEFLQGLQKKLVSCEVDPAEATEIVTQLLKGSAKLLTKKGDLLNLQKSITSKEGVTQAALESLKSSQLEHSISLAIEKAFERSIELKRD